MVVRTILPTTATARPESSVSGACRSDLPRIPEAAASLKLQNMTWSLDTLRHAFAFERAVVTPYTFATTLLPSVLSFYAMAVLVQLPRASFYRAALLPVVFFLTLRAGMSLDFSWNYPGYVYLNQGLALAMFTVALRSTAWAFTMRPYIRLPVYRSHKAINGHRENSNPNLDIAISSAMWNAGDLIINLRGLGWIGPQKMHIPAPYFDVESRLLFFLLSLCRTILFGVMFDISRRLVYVLGPNTFGTPEGGSIFDSSLPPLERYLKSSAVTLLSGGTAYTVIETVFHLHATLFVMLFQQYPSQWPPLFDSPWLSTSLTSFWGRRWHQLFREYFVAVGSKPMERYLGRTGVVLGAFTVSGFLHDVGMRGMDRGADTIAVVGFFIMQGAGIIIEHAWKQTTGKRVGGIFGWLWVFFWMTFWGQLVVDVWARRGLIGSDFGPEAYRPTTIFLNWISRVEY